MKKALMISFVLSFGLFICSCTGNFGDLLGTLNSSNHTGTPADTTGGHHGCPGDSLHVGGHHNDHDADDSTATGDTSVHIRYGLNRH
jgi:hypothetical protein